MNLPIHRVSPAARAGSQLTSFARFATEATGRPFGDYRSLHAFSTEDVARFWTLFLAWSGIHAGGDPQPSTAGDGISGLRFFPGLRLSWAENVLAARAPEAEDDVALVAVAESGERRAVTRREL
ncbi:MAG: hypothetical protein JOZ69_02500, partial [Myxococcales bacterium]|nr:hypothetical protein [Myxococcales bacterium]